MSVRLTEPITFETIEGTTHAPLVETFVNGVPTRLILDTGASDHLVTVDLCEAAGVTHRAWRTGDRQYGQLSALVAGTRGHGPHR